MRIRTLAIGFIFFIGLKFSIGSNSCDSVPTPYFTARSFPQEDVLWIPVIYEVTMKRNDGCYLYCSSEVNFGNGNLFFFDSVDSVYYFEQNYFAEDTFYTCIYFECETGTNNEWQFFEYCDSVRVYRNPTVSIQEKKYNGTDDFDIRYNNATQTLSIKSNDELNSIVQIYNVMGMEVYRGNFVREFSLKLDFLVNKIFFITTSNQKYQKVKYLRN